MSVVLLDAGAMRRTLGRMAHEILEANGGGEDLVVVGVLRKGWPVAKRLAFLMTQVEGETIPCGKLDATASRDDGRIAETDASEIPFEIAGKRVILVDEVIFTGRTVRAALDRLMTYGRPESVKLAVLVDRGFRELPIQPDYCGKRIETQHDDHIEVQVDERDTDDAVLLRKANDDEGDGA